jgi:KDO2-lipid IV(A) lauroyltransferase
VNDARRSGNDALTTAGYRLASLAAKLSPTPVVSGAAFALSGPLALAMRSKRHMVERHLRRIVPNASTLAIRQMTQAAFESYARYYLETFRLAQVPMRRINSSFTVDGMEHIERSAEAGKGTILALPHLGGWEWAGRWLVGRGYTLTAVVERLDNDDLFDWFLGVREELGFNIIPLDDRAGIAVNEALRANHVVALLCDRDIPRDGVRNGAKVTFFGETTTVPSGPAFFALRTGAPIIPLATYFTNRLDGHNAVVRPPIHASREGSLRDDVVRISQIVTSEIEALIRRSPEQWHLFQPNWPSDPGY